jgi:hypothetical protein
MQVQWETVAIPFASGIQPAARPRLLSPQQLLTAQNCFFFFDQGPQKRFGHVAHTVRTGVDPPGLNGQSLPAAPALRTTYSTSDPGLSPDWVYGWGVGAGDMSTQALTATPETDVFTVSGQPAVGNLFGIAQRDNEVVAWDGHRIFSYAPQQPAKFGETQSGSTAAAHGPASMPSLRAAPIAKVAAGQVYPDAADTGVIRAVAWINGDNSNTVSWSIFDSRAGTSLVADNRVQFQTPKAVRVVSLGPWIHILVADSTANSLEMRSIHQDNPSVAVSRTLGTVGSFFDVKKIDETQAMVARVAPGAPPTAQCTLLKQDGSTAGVFTPDLNASSISANTMIAIEVDASQYMALIWNSANTIFFRTYNLAGTAVTAKQTVGTVTGIHKYTLSPRWLPNRGVRVWDVLVEDLVGSVPQVRSYAIKSGTSVTLNHTRHRVGIGSHAFRVGHRTFLWLYNALIGTYTSAFQWTWFLCDAALLPVGKMDYGLANPDVLNAAPPLPGVNWHADSAAQNPKDRIVFHGCMPYRGRVVTNASSSAPNGQWAEPSIRYYELDFLPPLRSAQAGRSTYFAGAQLWQYDGTEMNEAGFHAAPEGAGLSFTPRGSAGGLSAGVYRYRVDLCHKNAQNEEVRSWSFISNPVTTVATDRVDISIPHSPMTRREDAYFLVFRTEVNQTTYYIVNSRDPSSALFVKNDRATATYTFTDVVADTALITQEYHPANAAGNYLDPLPAPACELVAAGRDRLWLAGGELSPGEIAPSRLFAPGQCPSFSPALNIQVDRNAEPISAIGFAGDICAIFRRTSTYILESDGPDNLLVGSWIPPRLAVADLGAVGPETLALTVNGLWFQSPSGVRLLTPSGSLDPKAGIEMDPITVGAVYSAAVVVPQNTQVRWYARSTADPTVVLDYSSGAWATWSGLECAGAVYWPVGTVSILAKGAGDLWVETPGVWSDAGSSYEMVVRVAWLHGANLGDFQRIRRFALYGLAPGNHTLRCRLFYNERPFHDEEALITFPGTGNSKFNTSIWGGNGDVWGSGSWGDSGNAAPGSDGQSGLWFRDGVYKFRFRPARQKCSVFSVEFSDTGAMTAGFQPVALALEIGKKPGLERQP